MASWAARKSPEHRHCFCRPFVQKKGRHVFRNPQSLQSAWRAEGAEHFIVQVERAAITTGVALGRDWMEHRDVMWFVDSGAALTSVVRGKSKCKSMESSAGNTHLMLMRDQSRV